MGTEQPRFQLCSHCLTQCSPETHMPCHYLYSFRFTHLPRYILHSTMPVLTTLNHISITHTPGTVCLLSANCHAENRTGQKNPDWLASISQAPTLSSVLKEMWGHKCMDCMVIGPDYQAGPRDKTNPHEMKTLHLLAIHSLT